MGGKGRSDWIDGMGGVNGMEGMDGMDRVDEMDGVGEVNGTGEMEGVDGVDGMDGRVGTWKVSSKFLLRIIPKISSMHLPRMQMRVIGL